MFISCIFLGIWFNISVIWSFEFTVFPFNWIILQFFFGYGSIYRLTLEVYNFLTWLSLRRLNPLPCLFSLYIALPCLINRENYGFALLTPFAVLCCSLPSLVLHNTLPFPFPLLLRPMHLASLSFLLPLPTSSKFLFSCSCFLPLGTR